MHTLGETYCSRTPLRYDDRIAKFALFPVSKPLTDLTGETVNAPLRPLDTDLETMPVENLTQRWDDKESAFVTVATLEVPPQPGRIHGETDALDDALAYSVRNTLDAHRPLGDINRAQDYRGRFNGCPLHQPRTLADLPNVPEPTSVI